MPKERRVLILVENLPSPFDRRVWQEAAALRDAGYGVSIVCPTGRGCEKGYEVIDGIHIVGVRVMHERIAILDVSYVFSQRVDRCGVRDQVILSVPVGEPIVRTHLVPVSRVAVRAMSTLVVWKHSVDLIRLKTEHNFIVGSSFVHDEPPAGLVDRAFIKLVIARRLGCRDPRPEKSELMSFLSVLIIDDATDVFLARRVSG